MSKIGNPCCLILLSFIISCNQPDHTPAVETKKLAYPSASAVEYYNGKLYIMGDDATDLIVLDTNLNILDSIPVISHPAKRIPKNIKPDFEASALINDSLFLFGSGSLEPYRNSGRLLDIRTKDFDSIDLTLLYSKVKQSGIEQINVEGACFVENSFLLVNRGNKSYPKNYLIVIDESPEVDSRNHNFSVIPFEEQKDTTAFKGISGLCYSKENDKLIMTVSTEDTRSVHEDGAIGKSYLWIVNKISGKLNSMVIRPEKVIDLETTDPRFKGQKIESATIIEETKNFMRLVLVADNDDGSSTIFKVSIKRD